MGRITKKQITMISPMNATITVQVFFVFPPSTNVCSNIEASFPLSPRRTFGLVTNPRAVLHYLTAFVGLFRATGGLTAGWLGASAGADFLRLSAKLCQNKTMGLAMNTEE